MGYKYDINNLLEYDNIKFNIYDDNNDLFNNKKIEIIFIKDNNIKILVFDMNEEGNIRRAAAGEKLGTLIY